MQIFPYYVRPALPGEDVAALKLLRDSHCTPEENLSRTAFRLELLECGQLDPAGILACIESASGDVVGGLLVPGDSPNSALAWPAGTRDPARCAEIEALLYEGLREQARLRSWANVLAFLDEEDGEGAASLVRGGFEEITLVREMVRGGGEPLPDREPLFDWVGYPDAGADRFAEAFRRCLVDSLDCPELNGLRSSAEILDGYALSAPDPGRWWLIRYRDIDIGTVILCDADDAPLHWEIAFMGLIPEARGAGLGRQLLHEMLAETSRSRVAELRVRCDASNLPAAALYRNFAFLLRQSYRVLLMRNFEAVPPGPPAPCCV